MNEHQLAVKRLQPYWPNARKGDIVQAKRRLDPEGANAPMGAYGIVIANADYFKDGCGPLVRWFGGGFCNVYRDDVIVHLKREQWEKEWP
jgi:hypothetical protein